MFTVSGDRKNLMIHSSHPARTLVEIVKWVDSLGIELADVHLKRPSLEDIIYRTHREKPARMKPYLALIKVDLKLAFRDKAVIFFNYLFPLIFFFVFAGLLKAERGGTISFVLSMVLVMGILGNGLFGAGVRAVQERELNILRRFKVTPISPTPILVASMISGWVIYMPIVCYWSVCPISSTECPFQPEFFPCSA